jgi:hypothetical protein
MEENKGLYHRFILFIKVKIYSWIIKSKDEIFEKLDPKPILNEKQKAMIEVVKSIVSAQDADLLIAPISGTRYVKLGEIYLKIDSNVEEGSFIELINGKFIHHVQFSDKTIDKDILKIFDEETEKRRKIMEKSIWDKTARSLESVLQEIEVIKNSSK